LRSERGEPLDWRADLPRASEFGGTVKRPSGKLKPGPGRPAAEVADHQQERIRGALLELVAEHGYAGITVRKLAGRAGVSTRSFYQHYPGKEACFLSAHQFAVRRVLQVVEEASCDAHGVVDRCLRLVVDAVIREWAAEPRAAYLMLVGAYAADLPALRQARLASRSIEARIGECLECAPDDAGLAPLAAEAIVAGVFTATRCRLLDGEGDLGDLCEPLGRWAAAYRELPAKRIEEISLAHLVATSHDEAPSSGGEERIAVAEDGDRGLLLTAAAKLVASRGRADLGLEEIASTAGISRRGFEAEFLDPEACVAAAHRLYADRAIDHVVRAEEDAAPAAQLASLGAQVAADPTLASLCFSDVAIAGPRLVRSHHRFLSRVASLAAGTTEAPGPAAEASAGALWGLLRQRVVMGRAAQAAEIAPALASLALLPLRAETSRLSAS